MNQKNFFHRLIGLLVIFFILITGFHIDIKKENKKISFKPGLVENAEAHYQFVPSSGQLVTGTEQTILSATAASTEGVNTGSWKGTLKDDDFHWAVASTSSGFNAQLILGGTQLNGANTLMIQTEFDLDATAPSTLVQICDWVTSTSVDNAADSQCTTGGWRTLNNTKTAITTTTPTAYTWHIYDGYWSDGSNNPISTPLSNFINGSNEVRIRYYSTTNTTSVVSIDYLRVNLIINSIYSAAGFTNLGSGSVTGDYSNTTTITQGASDNTRLQVAGTAGSVADFYIPFKNVKTYTGMNTILVRAEYSCSAAGGLTHRPKIYNFNSSSWEDLSSTSISCSTTDATAVFAKNNVTVSNYISSNEIRIGWRTLSNSTTALRLDQIYIIVGSTNTDTNDCEISFGTLSAGTCANTRDIDTTAATSSWNIATEDESNTFGHAYYVGDNDADAVVEEAAASNISFPVTVAENMAVVNFIYAGNQMSGTGGTVQPGIRSYAGTAGNGGWVYFGISGTTALAYGDNITVGGITWGGPGTGVISSPSHFIDSVNNKMSMRLRTAAAGATSNNSINQWDFAMMSLQWIEDSSHPTSLNQFTVTAGERVTGTEQTILSATAASTEGVNTGSWKGALEDDDFHWAVASTSSGINVQLMSDQVQLNGANSIMIRTEFDLDATAPSTLVQICDWVTSTSVDNAADSQCTTGGWRTLNNTKTAITTTTPTAYTWHIYDGYWSDGSNNPISTPLTNFVNTSNQMRVRYYSTTNTTSVVSIDYLIFTPSVSPYYTPAGFTNLGSGSVTGDYTNTTAVSQGASDGVRLQVAGTAGSIANFYVPFKGVKTYTGMNTIYLKYLFSCSNTGINYRSKIYNFNSSSWEDLQSAAIACGTTDVTRYVAKNNVTISNYISNGEIRIGWYGSANSTVALRLDSTYILLGTTNTDSNDCEISFGTVNAGTCADTRAIDSTITAVSWDVNTEDESNTFGHAYYALDNDADATVEEAAASHVKFSITAPNNAAVTSTYFASSHMSGTGGTVNYGLFDYSGFKGNFGGFQTLGSGGTTSLFNADSIQSANYIGNSSNAEDYVDTVNNKMWARLRTTTSGATSNNSVNKWDFVMTGLQWTETKPVYTQSAFRFFNNADSTDVGSALAAQDVNTSLGGVGAAFRLRMLMHLNNDDLRLSQKNFKLQYVAKGTGTCASPSGGTPSAYTDLTGSTLIAYNNNATPTDGTALTTNANDPTHSSDTIRQQTYQESNNFTNSQKIMNSGQDGLWDFSLKDNGAAEGTAYCFRMVESDGTTFTTYSVYPQITTAATTITMSLSDDTIGFGSLSSSVARWATGDTLGNSSSTSAHTITTSTTSPSGYTLYVQGGTLTKGSYTITAIGGSATASSPGSEQFGIRLTQSGGTGTVISPYNTSNFAYAANSTTQDDICQATAASTDTYTVYYIGNIANTTEVESYSTTLTYTVVGSF